MIEPRDRLDNMLNDALASYDQAAPPEGLELRTLARVVENSRSTHSPWAFLLIIAAALSFITAGLVWWNARTPRVQTSPPVAASVLVLRNLEPPRPIPVPPRAAVSSTNARVRKARTKPAAPKLPQFPASSPITREEQALVHLARGDAKYIPSELTNFGGPVQPIQITALEVKPLQLEWRTQEKTCCDQ